MTCNKCGRELRKGVKFCSGCGQKISLNNSSNNSNNGNLPIYILCGAVVALVIIIITLLMWPKDNTNKVVSNSPIPNKQTNTQSNSLNNKNENNVDFNSEYIFPTDRVYLTRDDICDLSKEELALLRNEIYARHGYVFKLEEYKEYFSRKSWYVENKYFDESYFNKIEKANKDFIVEYEIEMGWR